MAETKKNNDMTRIRLNLMRIEKGIRIRDKMNRIQNGYVNVFFICFFFCYSVIKICVYI